MTRLNCWRTSTSRAAHMAPIAERRVILLMMHEHINLKECAYDANWRMQSYLPDDASQLWSTSTSRNAHMAPIAECRISSMLHYFRSAGCCMTCNSGTCAQSSWNAPLILPHNHCIICEPFYHHRSLTVSLVPRPVSPMPLTCHILTWSRAGMQTGNVPPFLSGSSHELYDHTVRQTHHLSTQTSTQSRLDSHDALLLQHMHGCSSTL